MHETWPIKTEPWVLRQDGVFVMMYTKVPEKRVLLSNLKKSTEPYEK